MGMFVTAAVELGSAGGVRTLVASLQVTSMAPGRQSLLAML